MVSSLDPSFASAQTIPPNTRYHHNSHNMAYNKSYDPDALPRFAEPEPKPGAAAAHHHQQQQQQPPRFDQQHHTLQHHPTQPPPNHQQQYQPSRHNSVPQNPKYDHHQYQQQQQQQQYQQQQQQQQYQQQQQQLHHQQQRAHGARTPVQSHAMYATSPPQSATGHQPAPPSRPATSRPPPSPQQDTAGADPALMPLFRAVDKDGTGYLSERELSVALVNGDWTAFDIQTVRMMIRMFDSDRDGTVGFPEFCGIWSFLGSWRTLFDRFDVDRSGNISLREFSDALVAFRYRLSPAFVELIFRTYDKRGEGVMSFDLFVQACISLKRMTDVFKKYDGDRDGYITLSFEDFLSEILKQLK